MALKPWKSGAANYHTLNTETEAVVETYP